MPNTLLILLHNCVAHPLAGFAWAAGYTRAGDRIHGWWADCFDETPPSQKKTFGQPDPNTYN